MRHIALCEYCHQPFQIAEYRLKTAKFCSVQCKAQSQKGNGFSNHLDGYLLIKDPNHPRANKWGFVYQHILVAESFFNRALLPAEIVHHKNGDVRDNRPENLEIITRSVHTALHVRERSIAKGIADPTNYKLCRTCRQIKLRSEFSSNSSRGKRQTNSQCKPCAAAWQRQRRAPLINTML